MAINGINGINNSSIPLTGISGVEANRNNSVSFTDYLNEALNNVNNLQIGAEQIANDFAAGKTDNIHQVVIAAEKADIALQYTIQIRNKIMDAYSEIMRMQI